MVGAGLECVRMASQQRCGSVVCCRLQHGQPLGLTYVIFQACLGSCVQTASRHVSLLWHLKAVVFTTVVASACVDIHKQGQYRQGPCLC